MEYQKYLYKALISTTKEKKLAVVKRIAAAGAKKSGVRKIVFAEVPRLSRR